MRATVTDEISDNVMPLLPKIKKEETEIIDVQKKIKVPTEDPAIKQMKEHYGRASHIMNQIQNLQTHNKLRMEEYFSLYQNIIRILV